MSLTQTQGSSYQQEPLFPHIQNRYGLKFKKSISVLWIYIHKLTFHVISHLINMHGLHLKNAVMHTHNYMSVSCFFEFMGSFKSHSCERIRAISF